MHTTHHHICILPIMKPTRTASGCAPHYLPAVVQPLFDTNGPGQLSCDEGFDLPYPHTAPGFQYAPVKYGEDDTAVQVGLYFVYCECNVNTSYLC